MFEHTVVFLGMCNDEQSLLHLQADESTTGGAPGTNSLLQRRRENRQTGGPVLPVLFQHALLIIFSHFAPQIWCTNSCGGADQWETPVGKIFHDLWADLDTSLGASLEPPSSEIAKQICPVHSAQILTMLNAGLEVVSI